MNEAQLEKVQDEFKVKEHGCVIKDYDLYKLKRKKLSEEMNILGLSFVVGLGVLIIICILFGTYLGKQAGLAVCGL